VNSAPAAQISSPSIPDYRHARRLHTHLPASSHPALRLPPHNSSNQERDAHACHDAPPEWSARGTGLLCPHLEKCVRADGAERTCADDAAREAVLCTGNLCGSGAYRHLAVNTVCTGGCRESGRYYYCSTYCKRGSATRVVGISFLFCLGSRYAVGVVPSREQALSNICMG
jgi:hypothetical protein